MSTAKLVVAAGPGTGGTELRWGHTASASRDPPIWEPLSPQAGQAEVEVVFGPGWTFARAEVATNTGVLLPADPNHCQPSRAQSKSKPRGFCLENLTRKTQNPVQEGGAAAKGGAAGLGSSRNCWKLEFP